MSGIRGNPGVRVCTIAGDLDLASAAWVFADIDAVAQEPGLERLVLDVRALEHVDSSGLAVFVQAHNRSRQLGFALEVQGTSERLRRLLALTGLDSVLTLST